MSKKTSNTKSKVVKETAKSVNNNGLFTNPLIVMVSTAIVFILLFFALIKTDIISFNANNTNIKNNAPANQVAQNASVTSSNNSQSTNTPQATQPPAQNDQDSKDKGASIGPKKPIVPTKKPTPKPTKTSSNGSGFIIPKDIRVKPDASDAIKAVAKLHTYYAYYYGKAEDLSKNYPKNTIVFGTDEVANRSENGEWHTNHIRIILPKTCAKIKLNEFSDVYKITIDENDLSFNSLEKDNAMENTQYFLFDDCKGIAKTKYKKVVAGVFHRDFSKISDKYFKHFDYLSKPHQKRGLFGSWSTKYVFPDNISAKYKLQENKAYVILTTSKATALDTDMYMLTGEIEVR